MVSGRPGVQETCRVVRGNQELARPVVLVAPPPGGSAAPLVSSHHRIERCGACHNPKNPRDYSASTPEHTRGGPPHPRSPQTPPGRHALPDRGLLSCTKDPEWIPTEDRGAPRALPGRNQHRPGDTWSPSAGRRFDWSSFLSTPPRRVPDCAVVRRMRMYEVHGASTRLSRLPTSRRLSS